MRRIATALCAAGALLALLAPGTASAAFGPVGSFGSSGSGNGQFNHPQAAAVGQGQIFVADTNNSRVEAFNSSSGAFTNNLTGSPPPLDVAVDSNGVIYASSNGRVDRWVILLGIPIQQAPITAQGAYGVAADPSGTAFYASDKQGGVIRKYDLAGNVQATIGANQLSQPEGMTADASGIYVSDTGHARIVKFDFAGNLVGTWTMPSYTIVAGGSTFTGTVQPHDVAVGSSGKVFAPDAGTNSNLVAIFNADGSLNRLIGSPVSDPNNACRVSAPWGVATSGTTLFVVSTGENKIRVFDDNAPTGCPAVNFGSGGGINPGGGGGGKGGTAGAVSDRTPPTISFSGLPGKRCVRKNFTLTIHARDDVLLRKLTLYVNRRRVDSQLIYQQYWDVKVKIPVRKVRSALPRGAKFRVLIGVRVIDQSGKQSRVERAFKICG
jgi:sugar lactone lactonase YvrE